HVLLRVCSEPVAKPSTLVPDLGDAVDAFFERALDRDRDKRFQSAHEMASAFAGLAQPAEGGGLSWQPPPAQRPASENSRRVRSTPSFGLAPIPPLLGIRPKEPEPPAVSTTDRGSAKVWSPAPGVVVSVVQGHLCPHLARWLITTVSEQFSDGAL